MSLPAGLPTGAGAAADRAAEFRAAKESDSIESPASFLAASPGGADGARTAGTPPLSSDRTTARRFNSLRSMPSAAALPAAKPSRNDGAAASVGTLLAFNRGVARWATSRPIRGCNAHGSVSAAAMTTSTAATSEPASASRRPADRPTVRCATTTTGCVASWAPAVFRPADIAATTARRIAEDRGTSSSCRPARRIDATWRISSTF